jgi:hypothetical protein
VSSNDDLVSEEALRQDAREVAGLLREIERKCADPDRRADALRGPVRSMLNDCLHTAISLLGKKSRVMPVIDELLVLLVSEEEINLDMVQEDSAYVARALEDRFQLGAGRGYGGAGFSVNNFQLEYGIRSTFNLTL